MTYPRRRGRKVSDRGFSLIELSVILGSAAMLAATIAPVGVSYYRSAQTLRAVQDVEIIATAFGRYLVSVGGPTVWSGDGGAPSLLVSSGWTPTTSPRAGGKWAMARDERSVIGIDDVLYCDSARTSKPSWTHRSLVWRGPYLQGPTTSDPWGHRYSVNVGASALGGSVLVLSAGPDGRVDTPFASRAPRRDSDDVMFLLASPD